MINLHCKFCGNKWKPENLERGSCCPTCGAQVSKQLDTKIRDLEVRWYRDEALRTQTIFEGFEDGKQVWEEVFHFATYEDEIRTRLESKWPEWYEVIKRIAD